jgi:hypothetical protein
MIDVANEYPGRAVTSLPFDAGPYELAVAVLDLLTDPIRLEHDSRKAHARAREKSYRRLAEKIVAVCEDLRWSSVGLAS